MANTLMSLLVKLGIDSRELNDGLDKAKKKTSTWSKSLTKTGQNMMKTGGIMTATVTAPIVGGLAMAVNAASDMNESMSKMHVVFGDSGKAVEEWSKTATKNFGLSQQQAVDAAGTYGNLFTAMGLGKAPAAEMSKSLVGLAGNMASFNNASPEETLNAIRSGMSGEAEPLKKYGIALNNVTMQHKALDMGLGDNVQALTEAQKMQVRYAIIMDQTAVQQGDYLRTADGLANSTRTMKNEFANLSAQIGAQLLPLAIKLVGMISSLVEKFSNLTPAQQKTIVIVGAVVAAIGPLVMIIGGLASSIGAIIPVVTAVVGVLSGPVLLVIAAIIAVIALLYLAWTNNWGGIQEITAAAWAFIQEVMQAGMAAIQAIIAGVMTVITPLMQAWQAAMSGDWYAFGEKLREAWDAAWKLIAQIAQAAWSLLKTAITSLIDNVISFFKNTDWGKVGRDIITGIAKGLGAARDFLINAATGVAKSVMETFKGFFGIHSPSTLMENIIGKNLALGLTVGLEKGLQPQALQPSMAGVTTAASNVRSPEPSTQNDLLINQLMVMIQRLPDDLTRSNRDMVQKLRSQ